MLRRGISLLAVCSASAAFVATSPGASPVFSTTVVIQVTYATDCTFTVVVAGSVPITATSAPGTTIPPGPYQLSIRTPLPDASFDPSKCNEPLFSLTGPGVDYTTTVGAGFSPGETTNWTFPASSSYEIVDGNHPSAPVYFTTAATGTSTDLLPPPPPVPTPSGKGSVQQDIVGSAVLPFRGDLAATVAASGRASLAEHGKPFAKLIAGRYDIVVADASHRSGLFVENGRRTPVTVAGLAYTGKRTVAVTLTAGTWSFYARAGGARHSFTVTS